MNILGVHPHLNLHTSRRRVEQEEMSESQLPEQCTKCGLNFLAFGEIEIKFCFQCGCPRRVKPAEQAVDGEPSVSDSSTNGNTSTGHESTVIADSPDASHTDQGEAYDSTTEHCSTISEDAGPGADGPSRSTEKELGADNDLSQRQPKEAEKLTIDESDTVPEPKVIRDSESDCTSAQTHGAGQVEERPIPEDPTLEETTNSSVASGSNNEVLSACVNIHSQNSECYNLG
jgi:hypothetical protein